MPDLSKLSDDELLAMQAAATAPKPAGDIDLSKLSDADLLAMHAQATAPMKPLPKSDAGGIADAGMRGVVKGSTMGFGDELYGVVGAIANPTNSQGDFSARYHEARDYARRRDAQAEKDHSAAFTTGQVGGSLATAFAPGLGALNAGKGAGLIEMAGKGAMQGALSGSGDAKEFTDIPHDAWEGAKTGAAVGGALGVAGKVGGAVLDAVKPARLASVLLNVPEGAVQRYIESPGAVNGARPRAEIVQDFLKRAEQLKQEVVQGSKASRDILTKEGKTISGNDIADIFDRHADEIANRAEGVLGDDPQKLAAHNWLRGMAKQYRPMIPQGATDDLAGVLENAGHDLPEEAAFHSIPESAQIPKGMTAQQALEAEADRKLSTNRVKDLVQTLGNQTKFETAPGQFHDVSDLVRKNVLGDVNAALKSQSPAYAEQMKGVARDTGLLSDIGDLAKSPQGFDNLLKRTQRGNTPHLMDSLNQFDQRTGGGMMEELQNSAVKDALDKGFTNGSRNVNLHGGMAETIGEGIGGLPGKMVGKAVGLLGGATTDKYGGAIARGSVDAAAKIQSLLSSSEGLQKLGKFAGPLADAAKRGNQSLAVTHYMLSQQEPEYSQLMQGGKP